MFKAVLFGRVQQEAKTENEMCINRGEPLYTNLCRLKQKVEPEDSKNVVYAVECETCGVHYIERLVSTCVPEIYCLMGL